MFVVGKSSFANSIHCYFKKYRGELEISGAKSLRLKDLYGVLGLSK